MVLAKLIRFKSVLKENKRKATFDEDVLYKLNKARLMITFWDICLKELVFATF